jgi:hypothetical protein
MGLVNPIIEGFRFGPHRILHGQIGAKNPFMVFNNMAIDDVVAL